jgi:Zn finger protein HypA/HybF involved in hydrogenase expression
MPSVSNKDAFIVKAKCIHGDLYSYGKSEYITARKKITITCPHHGDFLQTPDKHLFGQGCPVCSGRRCQSRFVAKCIDVHGEKYIYDKVVFKNVQEKVLITCPLHGDFVQKPRSHLRGSGCPVCRESVGERAIAKVLALLDVPFVRQYKDPRCKRVNFLPFDFSISFGGVWGLIEYNGKQHYKTCFEDVAAIAERDAFKREFCDQYAIPLLVIKYTDFNQIEHIVTEWLNGLRSREHQSS